MARLSTYYLGRVHRINVDKGRFLKAILDAARIEVRKYAWTFIDSKAFRKKGEPRFVFGRLAKYLPQGLVPQVDEVKHGTQELEVDRFMVAASPFVYVPEFSGIAYQHVWNRIEEKAFRENFGKIIEAKFGDFFVKCGVEPIAEYREFIKKICGLKRITVLKAQVHPPNPLFGPLWRNLKEYLEKRKLEEFEVLEDGGPDGKINTQLPHVVESIAEGEDRTGVEGGKPLDIGDASILMAADGYGKAKVQGHDGSRVVVVRTVEVNKSFKFDAEPEPEELYKVAREILKEISRERYLKHGTEDK